MQKKDNMTTREKHVTVFHDTQLPLAQSRGLLLWIQVKYFQGHVSAAQAFTDTGSSQHRFLVSETSNSPPPLMML